MSKQPFYACGHSPETTIINSDPLTLSAWLDWKDTDGFDGDKARCWDCWCKADKEGTL